MLPLLTQSVFAGFGIAPSDFINDHLKPGMSYEQEFILSQGDPIEDITVSIEPDLGEMDSWFSFEPGKTFTIPKGQQRFPIKVKVTVPNDAALKEYEGVIRIKALNNESQQTGVSIVKGVVLETKIKTTNISVTRLVVEALSFLDMVPGDPLKLSMRIRNEGNVDAAPSKVVLDILDFKQEKIDTLESNDIKTVAAGTTGETIVTFDHSLEPGSYFAIAKVYLNKTVLREEQLAFSIKAPRVGEEKVVETVALTSDTIDSQFPFDLKSPEGVIAVLLALLIFCVTTVATAKILNKKIVAWKKIALIALTLLIGIPLVALAFLLPLEKKSPAVDQKQEMSTEVSVTVPTPEATASGAVQGVSTEAVNKVSVPQEEEEQTNPTKVTHTKQGKYGVYQEDSYTSEIVYEASEGESLKVLDENEGWYLVSLPDGKQGWLPKTSVKTAK